jgi:hypothetical protein
MHLKNRVIILRVTQEVNVNFFPVPKRHDINEYEASENKGPRGTIFDILANLPLENVPFEHLEL